LFGPKAIAFCDSLHLVGHWDLTASWASPLAVCPSSSRSRFVPACISWHPLLGCWVTQHKDSWSRLIINNCTLTPNRDACFDLADQGSRALLARAWMMRLQAFAASASKERLHYVLQRTKRTDNADVLDKLQPQSQLNIILDVSINIDIADGYSRAHQNTAKAPVHNDRQKIKLKVRFVIILLLHWPERQASPRDFENELIGALLITRFMSLIKYVSFLWLL
jgi:hypothetical protein